MPSGLLAQGTKAYNYYLKEYLWWRAVRATQSLYERRGLPSYEATKDPAPIFKTEAQGRLRESMESRARDYINNGLDYVEAYEQAIRETIADRVSYMSEPVEDVFTPAFAGNTEDCITSFENTIQNLGMLPLSPYDPTVSDREAFVHSGTRLTAIETAEIDFDDDGHIKSDSMYGQTVYYDVSDTDHVGGDFTPGFNHLANTTSVNRLMQQTYRVSPMSWNEGADFHLHKLASKLSRHAGDWRHIIELFSRYEPLAKHDMSIQTEFNEQVDEACRIVDMLDADGRAWRLGQGDRPGQLVVEYDESSLANSTISIRIMDLDEPEYVGRARKGNLVAARMYSNPPNWLPEKNYSKKYPIPPDPTGTEVYYVNADSPNHPIASSSLKDVDLRAPSDFLTGTSTLLISAPAVASNGQVIRTNVLETDTNGETKMLTTGGTSSSAKSANLSMRRNPMGTGSIRVPYNSNYTRENTSTRTYASADGPEAARTVTIRNGAPGRILRFNKTVDESSDSEYDPRNFVVTQINQAREAWASELDLEGLDTILHDALDKYSVARAEYEALLDNLPPESLSDPELQSLEPEVPRAYDIAMPPSELDGLKRMYLTLLLGEENAIARPKERPVRWSEEMETGELIDTPQGNFYLSTIASDDDIMSVEGDTEFFSVQKLANKYQISEEEARWVIVKIHSIELEATEIGQFDPVDVVAYEPSPENEGEFVRTTYRKSFNPSGIVTYASAFDGGAATNSQIAQAVSALENIDRADGTAYVDISELRGVDRETQKGQTPQAARFLDCAQDFDENTAVPISRKISDALADDNRPGAEFWNAVLQGVVEGLHKQGVDASVDDILVDDAGILKWTGSYATTRAIFKKGQERQFASPEDMTTYLSDPNNNEGRYTDSIGSGIMGPLFAPDKQGIVRCKFKGSEDFSFIPGYDGRIDVSEENRDKPLMDRMILDSYTSKMHHAIRSILCNDVHDLPRVKSGTAGRSWSLLATVRNASLSGRHEYDFGMNLEDELNLEIPENASEEERQEIEDRKRFAAFQSVVIQTEACRVSFDKDIAEAASPSLTTALNDGSRRAGDDTLVDGAVVTGYQSFASKTSAAFEGIFDPVATIATAKSQSGRFYKVADAYVDPITGRITPALQYTVDENGEKVLVRDENGNPLINENARTPLLDPDNEVFSYIGEVTKADAADRVDMTFINAMTTKNFTGPVKAAYVGVGFTQEDGIVITERFAKRYMLTQDDGTVRPLMLGDKLSDLHGNKGVITAIIPDNLDFDDPDVPELTKKLWEFSQKNPDVDVFMNPLSPTSRNNSVYQEAVLVKDGKDMPEDLVLMDDTIQEGSVITLSFLVTDKSADDKTHMYTEDEVLHGKGRRTSLQYGQILASNNVPNLSKELYGKNGRFLSDFAERALVAGIYCDPTSKLTIAGSGEFGAKAFLGLDNPSEELTEKINPNEQTDRSHRKLMFFSPDDMIIGQRTDKKGNVLPVYKRQESMKNIRRLMSVSGGTLLIPFSLSMGSGELTPDVTDLLSELPHGWPEGTRVYALPVESISLRQERRSVNDTLIVDDHTAKYRAIAEACYDYFTADISARKDATKDVNAIAKHRKMSDAQKAAMVEDKTACNIPDKQMLATAKAQKAYQELVTDIEETTFKDSIKEEGMAFRQPNSATMVLVADPTLHLNEMSISEGAAKQINLHGVKYILTNRDPALHDGNIMASQLKEVPGNDRVIGINPCVAGQADADFDGDTMGVIKVNGSASIREMKESLTVASRLLDTSQPKVKLADGTMGYRSYFTERLDIAIGFHYAPELKEQHEDWLCRVNAYYRIEAEQAKKDEEYECLLADGHKIDDPDYITPVERQIIRNQFVDQLDTILYKAQLAGLGRDALSFKDPTAIMESLNRVSVEHAGKGSAKALENYAYHAGFKWVEGDASWYAEGKTPRLEVDPDFEPDKDWLRGTHEATAIKSFYTGAGGRIFQLGIESFSDLGPEVADLVNKLTYPVTQALLQAKHDAAQAQRMANLVSTDIRHLWQGHKLEIEELPEGGCKITPVKVPCETNPIREPATPWGEAYVHVNKDEWAENILKVYELNGVPLDDDVVHRFVDLVAERMVHKMSKDYSDIGYSAGDEIVVGIQSYMAEGEQIEKNSLGQLGYDCDATMIYQLAAEEGRIYDMDNSFDSVFIPNSVRKAQFLEKINETADRLFDKEDADAYRQKIAPLPKLSDVISTARGKSRDGNHDLIVKNIVDKSKEIEESVSPEKEVLVAV